jgi:hypothetical protein
VKFVPEFYDDEITRCMPGKKDFASIKEHGQRSSQTKMVTPVHLE